MCSWTEGKLYALEVQRKDTVDHARRTRFQGAMVDSEYLSKGRDYRELPEVEVVYISEKDLWRRGKASYRVERKILEEEGEEQTVQRSGRRGRRKKKKAYDDGQHILYVNVEIEDGTETSELMKYFKTADPEDMSQGELSKRVRYLKKEEGGQRIMCEVMERIREEGREEGRREGRKEERKNTLREKSRADREKSRADRERARAKAAEKKVQELEKKILVLQMTGNRV